MDIAQIVDSTAYPLSDRDFVSSCAKVLEREGVLVLPDFIEPIALAAMQSEAVSGMGGAFFCARNHTVYLSPRDDAFASDHPRNRMVVSSKGCICDDDIASESPLRTLYDSSEFRSFVAAITGEKALYPYGDPLSSINIHYANAGQELGWHFDNSKFAITLLIQKPEAGGHFEYIKDLRDADAGEMNFDGVGELLDGRLSPQRLTMEPGTLVLFRGRNSIHRVSPTEGALPRMLAVLAYNSEEGVELSENARLTFYGRLC